MLLQILCCLLALVVTRIVWWRWNYDLHRIPSPPTISFFLESLKVVTSTDKGDLSELKGRWWKALGCPKIMKVNLFGQTMLWISDMRTAKSVVFSNRDPLPRAKVTKDSIIMLLGNDVNAKVLITKTGVDPYVKSVRRVYSTAFQSSNLKLALPKINTVIHRMLDIVETQRQQGPVDFQNLCVKMTLDVIGEVAFGANLGGLDGSHKIHQLALDVGHISIERRTNPVQRIMGRYFPYSQKIRRQNETVNRLTLQWAQIASYIMKLQAPPAGEEPIWYGLRNLTDPATGKRISFMTLLAEVGSVVLGGMDTTGHQLAWLLAILSNHPEVEDKLLEELKRYGLMGPTAREPGFDDLGALAFLNACIKEGMRVASISLTAFLRQLPTDMTILGYRLPKGMRIAMPGNRWMNSEADWGPHPEAFRPERWLTGEDMSDKYYLGFSYGPRDCVGQRLALTEMKLALIAVLRRYRLSPTVSYEALLKSSRNGIVIEARDGIWFNVLPREIF